MKRNLKWLGLGGVVAAFALFAMDLPAVDFGMKEASAQQMEWEQVDLYKACMANVEADCKSWSKRGGGEMPRGLSRDTKVELASGERYALMGRIEIKKGVVYLRIDLRKQPWLSNRGRAKNPFYRIEGKPDAWVKYLGKSVTVIGIARYLIWKEPSGPVIEIFLEPGPNPVIEGDVYR